MFALVVHAWCSLLLLLHCSALPVIAARVPGYALSAPAAVDASAAWLAPRLVCLLQPVSSLRCLGALAARGLGTGGTCCACCSNVVFPQGT